MPHYLYRFIELFGYMGGESPSNPGSDLCFRCVIEAPSEQEALEWGLQVHSDFFLARTMFLEPPGDGSLYRDGEIEGKVDLAEILSPRPNFAVCKVGEFPNWIEPWRTDEADGTRPASIGWRPSKKLQVQWNLPADN